MTARPALVGILAGLLAGAAGAEGPAEPAAPGWRVGLGVAGVWSQDWMDAQLGQRIPTIDPFGVIRSVPVGTSSPDPEPDGFSLEVDARVWLPVRLLRTRPWLEAGYRQPISAIEDSAIGIPSGLLLTTAFAVELQRAVTLRAGLDFEIPVAAGRALVLAPVLGADFTWYEARLTSLGFFVPTVETRTDCFGGVAAGVEARFPLLERGGYRVDAAFQTIYTRHFGSAELESTFSFFGSSLPLDAVRYEPQDALAVRFGLLLSLW
jgi:hypothetical protein